MIAAHPDDENTAMLAWLARGRHVRTGYLSLTRGEGGQNLIGAEQGDLLGIIRTQELLAARRIDGAQQFFTRAIDFGFTKTVDETLAKWGREKILADVVWVIRSFRPDEIVLIFSGTPRDGHGQHQSSAILGKEAFTAAADPRRFPEQLRYVRPWQARRLVRSVFTFTREMEREAESLPQRIEVDTGDFNPVLGRSYTEIAGMSRSMHRSQGMGFPERRGSSRAFFVNIAGEPATKDLFDGIDTSWNRVSGGGEVGRLIGQAIAKLDPAHPEKSIPDLLAARPLIAELHDPAVRGKLEELDEAVAQCAGLWLDAAAERYAVSPGESVRVRLSAIGRSQWPIDAVKAIVTGAAGIGTQIDLPGPLVYNRPSEATITQGIPPDQPYSQPFWLEKPKQGDTYTIDRQQFIGVPDALPVLRVRFEIVSGGSRLTIERPVMHRYVDPVWGEQVRPLVVVPPAALNMPEAALLFPSSARRRMHIQVTGNAAVSGDVRLETPAGFTVEPASRHFTIGSAGERRELAFDITPPAGETSGWLRAVADIGGRHVDRGMRVILHPPIPAQTVFPAAEEKLVRAGVKVTAKRVGYIMGAGDEMPEAIRQLGCEVTLLAAGELEQGDLSRYDAIVTGVRAYNVREDLRANRARLLDYVSNGGTLIVQYNGIDRRESTPVFALAPYPITISTARVSVEDAPVTLPDPRHPLLHSPNQIAPSDFEGWVQERGLYFASKWDAKYQPVLESHDPGEQPQPGGMLYARYGKGVYIFSAWAWFRQLPAGVPGAYRLFANMLSAR